MAISRDEASAMSKVQITILEQTAQENRGSLGNERLRRMSVMEVRRLLRKALIGDPATKAKWDAYAAEWQARERTYAAANFRAFERGEKGGRI